MSIIKTLRSALAVLALVATMTGTASDLPTVDINTANAEVIAEVLVGVGLAKAQAIIEYRQANGRFNDIYELTFVKGIGDATVERNEARIALESP